MTPAQVLFRWHRTVAAGPRNAHGDTPRIAFKRVYMRHDGSRVTTVGQADGEQLYRTWHAPDGEFFIHNQPLGRTQS